MHACLCRAFDVSRLFTRRNRDTAATASRSLLCSPSNLSVRWSLIRFQVRTLVIIPKECKLTHAIARTLPQFLRAAHTHTVTLRRANACLQSCYVTDIKQHVTMCVNMYGKVHTYIGEDIRKAQPCVFRSFSQYIEYSKGVRQKVCKASLLWSCKQLREFGDLIDYLKKKFQWYKNRKLKNTKSIIN